MRKTWIWFWTVFVVVLAGFGVVYWSLWQDSPQREGEKAKEMFSAYTAHWQNGEFAEMYEQLSAKTKQQMTKEQFILRYQNIYEGIEASHVTVEPLYNGPLEPDDDGTIKLHYRFSMETFVDPIAFTGKATLVKEQQNGEEGWYVMWNPSFLPPDTKGIVLRKKQVRYYPYKEAMAHLIGYTGAISAEGLEKRKEQGYKSSDRIGKVGLEQIYEERLRGSAGGRISILNAEGIEKKLIGEKPAKNGETVKLTIDAELQKEIYEQIKQEAGTAAAIHPKTGDILALVSTPAYDPNDFVLGMSTTQWNKLNNDPQKPLLNRFAHGYAPGSTFKPITGAIGLDTGAITTQEERSITGLHWQKDSSWGNYEVTRVSDYKSPVNLRKALVYSDNIYFAQTALAIGEEPFLQQATEFGFGEAIPIPFPVEKSKLTNAEMRNEIQLADSGYGQGEVTMTPLHLALVYSAYVNDGSMVYPSLIQGEQHEPFWKQNVMTKESAQIIGQDLLQVMEDPRGTGRGARVFGHQLAGKTGTAELKQKKGELGRENGWYAAINVDDPRLLLVMMVEDVRGRGGSHVLDSKVKRIFSQALP
ncbi:penicillin-binding transpeptidase domain-containing protein [Brevibacillus centrosporus]|uniref:penicillin-binding transpeptidase domain-containing protein n=1 Tax=Brevibacillus centrosporus TaxID=54910 RepID=UPI002E1ABC14|nr:penicillin-binding transpeptidase domain-containing protein [Brevibacillus centrosporus]MED4911549.1 penicillin-binding transpeptidase domain-containing protein [Brevibacillus centrosporus]